MTAARVPDPKDTGPDPTAPGPDPTGTVPDPTGTSPDLARTLGWAAAGASAFSAAVTELSDAELRAPSGLPGWGRDQLVAHVALNADALRNLLRWAETGIETPMYASPGARADQITAAAAQPVERLRDRLADADARFAAAVARLPAPAWSAVVRTARGRAVAAAEIGWMRTREVWVHWIDLATGADLTDLPPDVTAALLADAVTAFTGRSDVPPAGLTDRDSGRRWAIGDPAGTPVEVVGTLAELTGHLIGRPVPGSTVDGFRPPAWL